MWFCDETKPMYSAGGYSGHEKKMEGDMFEPEDYMGGL